MGLTFELDGSGVVSCMLISEYKNMFGEVSK